MKPIRDPERAELNHLLATCPLKNRTVLEIGCGDGSFARQYAGMANKVVGIDPAVPDLMTARKKLKSKRVGFAQSEGEGMPFPPQSFDIALFASSL